MLIRVFGKTISNFKCSVMNLTDYRYYDNMVVDFVVHYVRKS